jgi:putative ABC transport system permease protein
VSAVGNRTKAPILVTSAFAAGGYRFAPMSQEVMRQIGRIPGVALVVAEQEFDLAYGDESVLVTGFDPEGYLDRRVSDWPLDAGDRATALQAVADGDAVAVSLSFANLHGTLPGDVIELRTPGGPHAFKVAAVTSGVPQSSVLMSLQLYRSLWNDDLVSYIYVVVDDGHDVKPMAAQIARELGRDYRLRVWERAVILDHWASEARKAFSVQYVMAAIAMLLVLIGVSDTLAASVVARTREIGMMRAVGMPRSSVVRNEVLEGLAIAVFGLLLAGAIGLALGVFWVEVQFPAFLGWGLRLHVPLGSVIVAAIATLVLCLAGALLPSLRAVRMPVTVALRTE